jgi:AcrR family transcriptional regulator
MPEDEADEPATVDGWGGAGGGTDEQPPVHTWSDAEGEIMRATYRALLEHGYAGLSVSRIAEQLDKSKASIYYHYDSKDALLVAFLEYAADQFESSVATETGDDPRADLDHVVEKLLPRRPDEEQRQVQSVLLELRGQALTSESFSDQFTAMDERLAATVREILERGIETGAFRDVDAAEVAEHVLATVNGAMYARATTDREEAVDAVRDSLSTYLDATLEGESATLQSESAAREDES